MLCLLKMDWGGLLLFPEPWLVVVLVVLFPGLELDVLSDGISCVLTLLLKVTLLLPELELSLLYCIPYCFLSWFLAARIHFLFSSLIFAQTSSLNFAPRLYFLSLESHPSFPRLVLLLLL